MAPDPPGQDADAITLLTAHAVFLSDSDEVEMARRIVRSDDVGVLALRTCLCGVRVDGFDEYWNHLREVFSQANGYPSVHKP